MALKNWKHDEFVGVGTPNHKILCGENIMRRITRFVPYWKENEALRIKEYYERKYKCIVIMDFGYMTTRNGKDYIKVNYFIMN